MPLEVKFSVIGVESNTLAIEFCSFPLKDSTGQEFHETKKNRLGVKSLITQPLGSPASMPTGRISYLEIKCQQKALASLNKRPLEDRRLHDLDFIQSRLLLEDL